MQTADERFLIGAAWGLVATLVMSVVMALLWAAGLGEPVPLALAAYVVARILHTTLSPGIVALATIGYFFYGALWSGLLAASTPRVTWLKGLAVGLGLWMVMMLFFLPIGASPLGLANPAVWAASLIVHVVYGINVGLLAGRGQPELIDEETT